MSDTTDKTSGDDADAPIDAEATTTENPGEGVATATESDKADSAASTSDASTAEESAGEAEEDPWAAALAEQEAGESTDAGESSEGAEDDPWAAALAEQEAVETAAQEPEPEPPPVEVRGGSQEVFQPLSAKGEAPASRDLDIVMNIPVKLNVELGRTKISIRQLLELAQGSVLELDGLAGDPMDILINGYLIAQGEVVVVEDRYGIRITDIITPTERVEKLNR